MIYRNKKFYTLVADFKGFVLTSQSVSFWNKGTGKVAIVASGQNGFLELLPNETISFANEPGVIEIQKYNFIFDTAVTKRLEIIVSEERNTPQSISEVIKSLPDESLVPYANLSRLVPTANQ